MTRRSTRLPNPKQWVRAWEHLEDIARIMAKRDDLIALARMTPGGLKSGAGGVSVSGGSMSNPTEAEAISAADGTTPPDVVADWLDKLFDMLPTLIDATTTIERMAWLVDHRADDRVTKMPSGVDCKDCARYVSGARNDRVKGGRCNACHLAWRRWCASVTEGGGQPNERGWREHLEARARRSTTNA